jgi:hypothetical protein
MSITSFLNNSGFYCFEGYSQQVPEQVKDLIKLTNKPNINVMEIGFNAGHSAEVFLQNNECLTLTSFDLGGHDYVMTAKEYIDATYPNRHNLILLICNTGHQVGADCQVSGVDEIDDVTLVFS